MLRNSLFCLALTILSVSAWSELPIKGNIIKITGEEAISQPYRFVVEVAGPAPRQNIANLINTNASFRLPGGRMVYGVIQEMRALGQSQQGIHFQIVVGPKIMDAGLSKRFRHFIERDMTDIIEQVSVEFGQTLQFDLSSEHGSYNSIVQYGESDLNLIGRLLEDEGAYFFFSNNASDSTMVVKDTSSSAPSLSQNLSFAGNNPTLQSFSYGYAKHPGQVRLDNPGYIAGDSLAQAESTRYQNIQHESFTEDYQNLSKGVAEANTKLNGFLADALKVGGSSKSSALAPGYKAMVSGHPLKEANQSYFITSVKHFYEQGGEYFNEFTATPANVLFSPVQVADRPKASFSFGRVTGPAGEESYVNEYGQVKIALAWNEQSEESVWTSVAQIDDSSLWLPRINESVLIGYVDQDPSKPIVLGSLFDPEHMPPVALPDYSAVRKIGNPSLPGNNSINEILFDSKANNELLRVKAAKDMFVQTNNNHSESIALDKKTTVGRDQSTQVTRHSNISVQGNQNINVAGRSSVLASSLVIEGEDEIILKVGNQSLTITKDGIKMPQQATSSTPPTKTQPASRTQLPPSKKTPILSR